jgi:acyl-CoA dehydrogenase
MTACYEQMGRSILGPLYFNVQSPDDGNMFLLNRVGTE